MEDGVLFEGIDIRDLEEDADGVTMDPTPELYFFLPEDDPGSGYAEMTNATLHGNASSAAQDWRDEKLARIEVAIQALIFIFAVFGNSCVLVALRYRKRKTSRMHLFIMHLSVADLLVAFFNILPQMAWDITYRFQGSDALCRFVKYVQVMVIYLSSYILVMTAIDRYRAICHPISTYSWTYKKINIMIASAWGIAALLSLPQTVIFKMQEVQPGSDVIDCWADFRPEWTLRLYITSFALTVYIIPSLILGILYGRICYEVWINVRRKNTQNSDEDFDSGTPSNSVCLHANVASNGNDNHHGGCTKHQHQRRSNASSCGGGGGGGGSGSGLHNGGIGGIRYKFTGTGQISVLPGEGRRGSSNSRRSCQGALGCTAYQPAAAVSAMGGRGNWARKHSGLGISRSKMKTIKLTIVVIVAYLVCWSPFVITQLWWAYDDNAPSNHAAFVICLLLASLNSCCNPWIYMAFSGNLIQQILPCCQRNKKRPPAGIPGHGGHRERVRFAMPPACRRDSLNSDENEKRYPEGVPLQVVNGNDKADKLRRKSTLSRTSSTKLTNTLYRTDSRNSRQYAVQQRYPRENGYGNQNGGVAVNNWPPWAIPRAVTKVCQCKQCVKAMTEKDTKHYPRSSSSRDKSDDAASRSSSSKNSNSGSTQRKWTWQDGKMREKPHSDNGFPFLSYKCFDGDYDENVKFTSV